MNCSITSYNYKGNKITSKIYNYFSGTYQLIKEVSAKLCSSDDYHDSISHNEIIEATKQKENEVQCVHCNRTASNGIKCLGMCVAENEY